MELKRVSEILSYRDAERERINHGLSQMEM